VQLAIHGSHSKINFLSLANFTYQKINCIKHFDIVNLDSYDLILGTPFLYQHSVTLGLNPTRINIGSQAPSLMVGEDIAIIPSAAAELFEECIQNVHEMLLKEAADLSPNTDKMALPPLRAINHSIPLIDEKKIYSW
jgi:hypothetical protein